MPRLAVWLIVALVGQSASYTAQIDAFRRARAVEIGGVNGWASLTDLTWVTPGRHTVGRASSNDVVLKAPSAPLVLGTLVVGPQAATLDVARGVDARVKGQPVRTVQLTPNVDPDSGVAVGGMRLVLITRGRRTGLRVWDERAPKRLAFTGLHWQPVEPSWRITATYTAYPPGRTIKILNVLGDTIAMDNPGFVTFTAGGRQCRLEAMLESPDAKELFFIFRDQTSGDTTYPPGRYLYTDLPKNGHVVLDFNEAMNPPCAFTAFATCPLPPPGNTLPVAVAAGELRPH